ncbi:hypothetical protein NFX46_13420 [Streptomyces phaeoluteigriseus]|uniref:PIN domain-containing protein n=1 Tax=Streptomyces phaeoluteigriseus TaxID=114686 RepID=A0ABY4Z6M8_9ACTN|nr:hypothetical protein [Streptomyces phaeoluteigriseus]USQ84699.1 hypothetical protein NFX46_13420 [Streptomyces phaeoluteigriseus]
MTDIAVAIADTNALYRLFIPKDTAPHLRTAMAVMRGYVDADGGAGVGLVDAMNVALAATFQTADTFTTDGHFRMRHGVGRGLPRPTTFRTAQRNESST